MKRMIFAALLLAVSACCNTGMWTKEEKELINGDPKLIPMVMRVLSVDEPADSAVLHTPCTVLPIKALQSPEYATLAAKLLATVTHPSQDGVGIAAPQVGISRRIDDEAARSRLREIAGLPGEETATLTVPARGALCNPSHWNETEFDALFPLLADELDEAKRDSLRVEMVWTSEGQTIERRVAAADHWLDRYEMRRQASSLASHRLGAEISWNRSVKIGDSLLTEHVWNEDRLMLAPKNAAYSSWLLPKDSVRGRVIALF